MNEYNDVEFSVGILLRSLMMDSIQTQYLASLIEKNLNESKAKIIDELSHCCLKFMTDSTGFILNEILDNDSLSTKQKENNKENILRQFRNLQLNSIGKYKSEKIILKDIYEKSKSDLAKERNAIYDIYTMYSKYDHLSYWTAFVSNKMSFDKRLNFLDKAIFLLILNLRTLLFIACNYGDKIVLDECLLEVENYLNKK